MTELRQGRPLAAILFFTALFMALCAHPVLAQSTGAPAAGRAQEPGNAVRLDKLAQWWPGQMPAAFAALSVAKVVMQPAQQPTLITGTLPIMQTTEQPGVQLIGFRASAQTPFSLALVLPRFSLGTLVPALGRTPLADVGFERSVMILVPPGMPAADTPLPPAVAQVVGRPSIRLTEGANFIAWPAVYGQLGGLLAQSGIGRGTEPMTGRFDPLVLALPKGAALPTGFLQSLELTVPLATSRPAWMDGFMTLAKPRIDINGRNGRSLDATLSADVSIDLEGNKRLVFADTQFQYDFARRSVTLSSGPMTPAAGLLALPDNMASIDRLSLSGSVAPGSKEFTVNGSAQIEGRAEPFTMTLAGAGTSASYTFGFGRTQSLASLLGWQVPGLEDIQVSNITLSGGGAAGSPAFTGGTIRIGGVAANIFVFKPSRPGVRSGDGTAQTGSGVAGGGAASGSFGPLAPIVAMTLPNVHLPDLIPQLKGSPLDGLQIAKPGFLLAPPGFTYSGLTLPGPVATHTGSASMDVKGGFSLQGLAMPSGPTADLLNAAGLQHLIRAGLPLKGGIDPRLLKAGSIAGDIAAAIIASIDFSVPLGPLALPGAPSLLSASSSTLAIKGHTDGVTLSLAAPVALTAGAHRYVFDSTMTVARRAGQVETTLSGNYPAASERGKPSVIDGAFGISWLKLDKANLSVTFGAQKSIAVSGITSMGRIRNLDAAVFVDAEGRQVTDFGVSLTGADIGLDDIPGFAAIKRVPDIRFRDVLISESEVAGTLRTSNRMFDNLRAVIFRSGTARQLTLAARRENFTLEDIVTLTGPGKALFAAARVEKGLLVVSEGGVQGPISALPRAAAQLLGEVYGSTSRSIRFGDGFNVAISVDPGALSAGAGRLGVGRSNIVLDGGIEGVFGGTPSFMLSAAIPPINLPRSMSFLDSPRNLQTSFFTRLTTSDAALGINISGDFPMKTRRAPVVFSNALALEVDTQGGLAIQLTGTSDSPWVNPLGIPGMTLNAGTSLGAKVSATSEVDLTFIGKSKIGSKEIDLTGSAGILAAEGVIDKGAFEGKLSELGLADIVALSSAATVAAGGTPPTVSFPTARLTGVDVAFASPGAVVQGMNLAGGGARVAGEVWLILKDKPLGKFLGQVDGNGLVANGAIADFTIGPVALSGNSLDVRATLSPPAPPYFKVKGGARIFGKDESVELALAAKDMELAADIDLGDLLKFDFRATAEIPGKGLTVSELEKSDMSLRTFLRSDIPAWLRGPGRKAVEQSFATVQKGLVRFTDELKAAQKKVSDLDKQIDDARSQVKGEKHTAAQSLQVAEDRVNTLTSDIARLRRQIEDAKSDIHDCDYKRSICTWYDVIKRECTSHRRVADLGRDASCAVDNVKARALVVSRTAERDTLEASKVVADSTLAALRRGETVDDTDLDPRVAPLIAARATAQSALTVAQDAAQGALRADSAIRSALDAFARNDAFVLNEGLIQGSLHKSVQGRPLLLALNFTSFGKPYDMDLAFSMNDPVFDAEQLATLGLFIASRLLDDTYGNDPAMGGFLALVHQAYVAAHDAEKDKLDAVRKENGLE